jgi:uncharacterized protein YqeY
MLRDRIQTAMKEALKQGQKDKLAILRMILSGIKDKDVAIRVDTTSATEAQDEHILKLLETMIKQRRQSIDLYTKGDRSDLAAKEQAEIAVLQEFLPQQLTEAEQEQAIKACIQEAGAASVRDMGAVMSCLKQKYAGQMDFAKASAHIKSLLN